MASGKHAGSTPGEPDPTPDTCEEPSLLAGDKKKKKAVKAGPRLDLGLCTVD